MLFSKVSLVLSGAATAFCVALPLAENGLATETLQKRAGGLFFCKEPNFVQPCDQVFPPLDGSCHNFPQPGYHDVITSIGPDSDIVCTLYAGTSCSESEPKIDGVVTPGWTDLRNEVRPPGSNGTPGSNWDNALDSYRCWRR
ncbi:hypothetical protein B0O99DRAFT_353833 [Bisporella sp. PMI_857]|nr:hypothetical protein B0O99DRAFT_353833 [Bisporella sp. PMI_857]